MGFLCPLLGMGEVDHQTNGPPITGDRPRPFAMFGARLGVERRFQHIIVRGFLEAFGLPGSTNLAFYGHQQWRTSAGGAAGVGLVWQP
jgi:hypothetical protein